MNQSNFNYNRTSECNQTTNAKSYFGYFLRVWGSNFINFFLLVGIGGVQPLGSKCLLLSLHVMLQWRSVSENNSVLLITFQWLPIRIRQWSDEEELIIERGPGRGIIPYSLRIIPSVLLGAQIHRQVNTLPVLLITQSGHWGWTRIENSDTPG